MSKHTPGPWMLDEDTYNITSESGLTIAYVSTVDDYSGADEEYRSQLAEECADNARLVAAAPDLYEACEAAYNYLDSHMLFGTDDEARGKLRAALRKAGAGHWGEDDADDPDDLAQQEALLIVEYMDVHGYSLEDARAAAAREITEANEMRDEDWMTIE